VLLLGEKGGGLTLLARALLDEHGGYPANVEGHGGYPANVERHGGYPANARRITLHRDMGAR
jgi:hypothetical protein